MLLLYTLLLSCLQLSGQGTGLDLADEQVSHLCFLVVPSFCLNLDCFYVWGFLCVLGFCFGLFYFVGLYCLYIYIKFVNNETFCSQCNRFSKISWDVDGALPGLLGMKDPESSMFSADAAPHIAGLQGLHLLPWLGGKALRLWYEGSLTAQNSAVKPQITNMVWVSTSSLVLEPGLKSHCCSTRNQETMG